MSTQTSNPSSQPTTFTEADISAIAEMVAAQVKQEMQAQMQALQEENLELQDQLRRLASFNPHDHLMQIGSGDKAKDYLEVKWRLVWFRLAYPHGTIDSEEVEVDLDREVSAEVFVWNAEKRRSEKTVKTAKGYARFHAVVTDGKGGRATGTGSESAVDFPDFIEKSETKAIGRALAALGFGTQFTGDELNEAHRIVDSPVDGDKRTKRTATTGAQKVNAAPSIVEKQQQSSPSNTDSPSSTVPSASSDGQGVVTPGSGPITEPQRKSLLNLYAQLGEEAPDLAAMTEAQARIEIPKLNNRLREKKQNARPTANAR